MSNDTRKYGEVTPIYSAVVEKPKKQITYNKRKTDNITTEIESNEFCTVYKGVKKEDTEKMNKILNKVKIDENT